MKGKRKGKQQARARLLAGLKKPIGYTQKMVKIILTVELEKKHMVIQREMTNERDIVSESSWIGIPRDAVLIEIKRVIHPGAHIL